MFVSFMNRLAFSTQTNDANDPADLRCLESQDASCQYRVLPEQWVGIGAMSAQGRFTQMYACSVGLA